MFKNLKFYVSKIKSDLLENSNQQAEGKTIEPRAQPRDGRRPPPSGGRYERDDANKQSLNMLIKESNNAEALQFKKEIDDLRKERSKLIVRVKDCRRRLGYKEAESVAIERLLNMKKEEDKDGEKRRKIGYLKRMKQKLEFKISTEASSLAQEKDIVRKINDINHELDEALASVRLERKVGFIKKDIEDYRKSITEVNLKVQELDTKLDGLYTNLRKTLGIGTWQNKQGQQQQQRPKKVQQHNNSINLEDIAVIKKKEK
jgi:uncharacterized coiled-coil DUF342 family protein